MFRYIKSYNLAYPLSGFFSLAESHNKIYLYYRAIPGISNSNKIERGYGNIKTYVSEFHEEKGLTNTQAILEDDGICHNFSVFRGHENKLMGFGGWEDYRHNGIITKKDTYEEGKNKLFKFYYKDFYIGENKFNEMKKVLGKYIPNSRGMYVMVHHKNNKFKKLYDAPVIGVYSKGYIHNMGWKISNFDGFNSVLYDGENYHVYLRANIKLGVRHLQHAVFNKDWRMIEPFSLVELDIDFKEDTDEYYIANFLKYPFQDNLYFALLPYVNKKKKFSTVRLFVSYDARRWLYKKDFLKRKLGKPTAKSKTNKKAFYHPVQNFYIRNKTLYFLFHSNYYRANGRDFPSTLELYTVGISDFEKEIV